MISLETFMLFVFIFQAPSLANQKIIEQNRKKAKKRENERELEVECF